MIDTKTSESMIFTYSFLFITFTFFLFLFAVYMFDYELVFLCCLYLNVLENYVLLWYPLLTSLFPAEIDLIDLYLSNITLHTSAMVCRYYFYV